MDIRTLLEQLTLECWAGQDALDAEGASDVTLQDESIDTGRMVEVGTTWAPNSPPLLTFWQKERRRTRGKERESTGGELHSRGRPDCFLLPTLGPHLSGLLPKPCATNPP